ncbi:MAG: hypothetical protein EZS28_036795, partial [Streblomastix strix]
EDEAPTARFIERWASHFEEYGDVNDSSRSDRPPSSLTEENKQKILQNIKKIQKPVFVTEKKKQKSHIRPSRGSQVLLISNRIKCNEITNFHLKIYLLDCNFVMI